MLVRDFDFHLPEELIAQEPTPNRDGARMLTLDRATGALEDRHFRELPELLIPGDVLVVNDSRVLPARLYARRVGVPEQAGHAPAPVEVMLIEQLALWEWKALVRPGKKVSLGTRLAFSEEALNSPARLEAEVIERGERGARTIRFDPVSDFFTVLDRLGHMPLPPYIHREDRSADRERYQTVYANRPGSVAAPTAGLHFSLDVLDRIRARGVTVAPITLHVGLGTFQPVRVEQVDAIKLHTERYSLPAATAGSLNAARREGRRVIAAGTTVVRTLEHCARETGSFAEQSGQTSIFLSPGDPFRVVSALLTNFHLPQSTLLMLVSAFAGHEHVMAAYRHAVSSGYRFFSYGDCMWIS